MYFVRPYSIQFLGAKAPLGSLDVKVKVKVKAKKLRNSMIMPEFLSNNVVLLGIFRHNGITNIIQYYLVLPNIDQYCPEYCKQYNQVLS